MKRLVVLLVAVCLVICSCGCIDDAAQQGPQGERGPEGPGGGRGPRGLPGSDSLYYVVVGASDSTHLANVTYECDGVDDQVEIEAAMNSLPSSGGTVHLLSGTYWTSAMINITNYTTFAGEGHTTVIKPVDAAKVSLTANASAGQSYVTVGTPSSFRVGMSVHVADDNGYGTFPLWAKVTSIIGSNVHFQGYSLDKDYTTTNNSYIINAFHPLLADRASTNITITDLRVDGNRANIPVNYSNMGYCVAVNADYSVLSDCQVVEAIGDATIINGNYVQVSDNYLGDCEGHGIHLSGGCSETFVVGNTLKGGNLTGLFYCANIERTTVTGNTIVENYDGIDGYGLNEAENVITGNVISRNDRKGFSSNTAGFSNLVLTNNIIMNNGQHVATNFGVHVYGTITNFIFKDNLIGDDQVSGTQWGGFRVHAGCSITDSIIEGNILFGHTVDFLIYGTVTGLYDAKFDVFMDVVNATTDYIDTIAGTGAQIQHTDTQISGLNVDVPRSLTVTCTNNNSPSGSVSIYGINAQGESVSENVVIVPGGTAGTIHPYSFVTLIVVPPTVPSGDTVTIGVGSKLGLSLQINAASDVFKVKKNNTDYSATGDFTVDATYAMVDVSTGGAITNGDDFTIYYKRHKNLLLS